jgi:hypothetical protein
MRERVCVCVCVFCYLYNNLNNNKTMLIYFIMKLISIGGDGESMGFRKERTTAVIEGQPRQRVYEVQAQ